MVPVVICGAGPVGLVLAMELAEWQVPVLLVERHRRPSPFPRGRAISIRSMEILRRLGLEREVAAVGLPRTETASFFAGSSLTATKFGRVSAGPVRRGAETSPTAALACPQDRFEELLRERVLGHPLVDARFGTELLDARQHADHVEVRLQGGGGGEPSGSGDPEAATSGCGTVVRASWLVGADGSRSRVRQLAGIGTDCVGESCSNVNILLDAELGPLIRDRSSLVYTISNAEVHATVLTVDNRRRWLVNVLLPDSAQVDPTPQWCARMVRAALGRDHPAFRVVTWTCWEATAWLAHRYRQGRFILTGDAAHVCTPYGGFGMNLGLADAHNLARTRLQVAARRISGSPTVAPSLTSSDPGSPCSPARGAAQRIRCRTWCAYTAVSWGRRGRCTAWGSGERSWSGRMDTSPGGRGGTTNNHRCPSLDGSGRWRAPVVTSSKMRGHGCGRRALAAGSEGTALTRRCPRPAVRAGPPCRPCRQD